MEPLLQSRLQAVARRRDERRLHHLSRWILGASVLFGLVLYLPMASIEGRGFLGLALLSGTAVALIGARTYVRSTRKDPRLLARHVESAHPELDASLITAIELEPDLPDGRYGFLARRLLDDVLQHARRTGWEAATPHAQVRRARRHARIAAVAFLALLSFLLWPAARGEEALLPALPARTAKAPATADWTLLEVTPGDCELEKGRSLLVSARFGADVPEQVQLVVTFEDGVVESQPMRRSLEDPLFGARLSNVTRSARYHLAFGSNASNDYRLDVFERPSLVRSDVRLEYPSWARMEPKTIEDTRRVTAVEGTALEVTFHLNVPVAVARLVDRETDQTHDLVATADPKVYTLPLMLERSRRFLLELADAKGRSNALPPEFVFEVLENGTPDLRLLSRNEERVSPLQELRVEAQLQDDFGLVRYGVQYGLAGREPVEVVLGEGVPAREAREARHVIALEDLDARPDQLLTYHLWAEDHGPDGNLRRIASDLELAEVRPFEEIFREGESPAGGAEGGDSGRSGESGASPEGQGGGNAAELAELQKQILQATWKLRQRPVDETFLEDVGVVRDAQREVLEKLEALSSSPAAQAIPGIDAIVESARGTLERAVRELERAAEEGSHDALDEALRAEQEAYQEFLRMRLREFEVARSQQSRERSSQSSNQGRSSAQPSQRQLEQLELRNDANRYETESRASAQNRLESNEADRETREVLDRLRQLARRQEDLNRELQELRAELEAKDEETLEEARRRLKRLQEEQRELLEDTDELRQRLEQPSNRERLAEERESLERARESVRRSTESLEREDVSQAVAEGARAERELEDLEREMRDRAGSEFEERMRSMRREARELEQRQERLAGELEAETEQERPSLRATPERERLERDLREQEERVTELLRDVEETVREAEELEPLLAQDLFDTLRRSLERGTGDAVRMTREMVERGFEQDADEAARAAREGLSELREGVEEASERVLGSGEEALARAERELERLDRELREEVERARGEAPAPGQPEGERRPTGEEPRNPGATEGPAPSSGTRPRGEGEESTEGREGSREPRGEGEPQPSGRGSERSGEERTPEGATARDRANSPRTAREDAPRGGSDRPATPLTGEDFLDWADRLRDVEDMLDDPELRDEAARIRQRAKAIRAEFKRHSKEPRWDLVEENVASPLTELNRRVKEELARRRAQDGSVPIDRDPVPPRFQRDVDRYYERLGREEGK